MSLNSNKLEIDAGCLGSQVLYALKKVSGASGPATVRKVSSANMRREELEVILNYNIRALDRAITINLRTGIYPNIFYEKVPVTVEEVTLEGHDEPVQEWYMSASLTYFQDRVERALK